MLTVSRFSTTCIVVIPVKNLSATQIWCQAVLIFSSDISKYVSFTYFNLRNLYIVSAMPLLRQALNISFTKHYRVRHENAMCVYKYCSAQ